ncbi:MAG: transporter [Paenibacillaceae bacterium]|jgi:putative ABC transport system ATP-binding protein|nr:transporter [Paenibacillaceae bacterium]
MGAAMIELHGVRKDFVISDRRLPILHIPHWTVEAGGRLALLGPSGSGKSTVLHLLSGILKADRGELRVADTSLHELNEAERDRFRLRHVGYIMQDFHLIGSLTAAENVELMLPTLNRSERRKLLREWFGRVGLADRMDHLPGQLSRGQQQRTAIVRALINQPPLVLADEPTGSLDYESAELVMRLLLELCASQGSTLVTVTHDLHLAQLFPERIGIGEINTVLSAHSFHVAEEPEGGALA